MVSRDVSCARNLAAQIKIVVNIPLTEIIIALNKRSQERNIQSLETFKSKIRTRDLSRFLKNERLQLLPL